MEACGSKDECPKRTRQKLYSLLWPSLRSHSVTSIVPDSEAWITDLTSQWHEHQTQSVRAHFWNSKYISTTLYAVPKLLVPRRPPDSALSSKWSPPSLTQCSGWVTRGSPTQGLECVREWKPTNTALTWINKSVEIQDVTWVVHPNVLNFKKFIPWQHILASMINSMWKTKVLRLDIFSKPHLGTSSYWLVIYHFHELPLSQLFLESKQAHPLESPSSISFTTVPGNEAQDVANLTFNTQTKSISECQLSYNIILGIFFLAVPQRPVGS